MTTQIAPVNENASPLMALINRAATDEGFNVEKLEKLLDVKERWDADEARKAYVAALAAFKRTPPQIVKDQEVDFSTNRGRTHYRHASLGQVAAAVAAALANHGLSHSWAVSQQEKGGVTVTCTLTHELGHAESVSISGPADDSGNKNAIQQVGSAITYLERYTLMAITGLAASDMDDDGVASGACPGVAAQPQPQRQNGDALRSKARADYLAKAKELFDADQEKAIEGAEQVIGKKFDEITGREFADLIVSMESRAQREAEAVEQSEGDSAADPEGHPGEGAPAPAAVGPAGGNEEAAEGERADGN